jgi:hypothetical protein
MRLGERMRSASALSVPDPAGNAVGFDLPIEVCPIEKSDLPRLQAGGGVYRRNFFSALRVKEAPSAW